MANVLSLALKINADASGLKLDPVEKALRRLGEETDRVSGIFSKFTGTSEAAARAQAATEKSLNDLVAARKAGTVTAQEFAESFAAIEKAAQQEAAALQRAAQITESNLTPLQKYERTAADLKEQLDAGRISQETYSRAMGKAKSSLDGAGDSASKADKSIQELNANVSLLTKIEVGRVLIDGFQALSGVFQRVTGQITSLVSNVNSSLDTLNDFSARTGIGVEALQGYSLAAKLAGVDTEQFGTAVQKLAVNIGKATPGDQLDKSLRGIGLSVAELRALAPERQFSAIGDAISQLPTAADRAAAAVEIFGKQGAALAPLFREGAASIDELRNEADKLGIIVSDVQINNIASMNDAFDKVFATVQGIVGQVIGNLAPAVTDVTNQFLEFVKNFNSGEGGKGIANAITDVLLQGAAELEKVFNYAVSQFNGFSGTLSSASDVFNTVGNVFSAVGNTFMAAVESLRAIFNFFELAGNKLMIGLGDFLAGIGSWVSSDLEAAGKALADESRRSAEQNAAEMEQAASNAAKYAKAAADATVNVFTGGSGSIESAGKDAAEGYFVGMRKAFQNSQLPEVKLETNAAQLREQFDTLFKGITDQTSNAAKAMAAYEQSMAAAKADGQLTVEEISRLESLQRDVNAALDEERRKRQETIDITKQQVEADQKRVEALLTPSKDTNKLEEDLAAVYREQARVQEQLAAARAFSKQEDADAAAARLAQLDQIQAKLEETQQADAQGFGDGFGKAFEATAKSLDSLIDKAAQFGNEGAKAAQELQAGIARAQEQVRAGILSQPAYEAEVAAQRKIFEQRIAQQEELAKREAERQQAVFQAQVDANERLNQFLLAQDGGRRQAEIAAAEEAFKRRTEAALNLEAIENRIAQQRQAIEAAREANDFQAAKARVQELKTLEALQKQEKAIAEGKQQANRQINNVAQANADAQQTQLQAFNDAAQRQVQQTQQAASNAVELTNKAFASAAQEQQELFDKLNTLGSQTVQAADVRTAEGAALVLGLAANAQDPALIEARMANKILRQIATGLTNNLNRIGVPAALI